MNDRKVFGQNICSDRKYFPPEQILFNGKPTGFCLL